MRVKHLKEATRAQTSALKNLKEQLSAKTEEAEAARQSANAWEEEARNQSREVERLKSMLQQLDPEASNNLVWKG